MRFKILFLIFNLSSLIFKSQETFLSHKINFTPKARGEVNFDEADLKNNLTKKYAGIIKNKKNAVGYCLRSKI